MSIEETRRRVELENYFSVLPAFRGAALNVDYSYPGAVSNIVDKACVSSEEVPLTHAEIKQFLRANSLLD